MSCACGWEDNRRPGVTLATRQTLVVLHLRLFVYLFAWGLKALSAQIGYIVP